MKVSDLILELQEFYQEHADLEVMVRVEAASPPSALQHGTLRPITAEPALSEAILITSLAEPNKPVCVVEL